MFCVLKWISGAGNQISVLLTRVQEFRIPWPQYNNLLLHHHMHVGLKWYHQGGGLVDSPREVPCILPLDSLQCLIMPSHRAVDYPGRDTLRASTWQLIMPDHMPSHRAVDYPGRDTLRASTGQLTMPDHMPSHRAVDSGRLNVQTAIQVPSGSTQDRDLSQPMIEIYYNHDQDLLQPWSRSITTHDWDLLQPMIVIYYNPRLRSITYHDRDLLQPTIEIYYNLWSRSITTLDRDILHPMIEIYYIQTGIPQCHTRLPVTVQWVLVT